MDYTYTRYMLFPVTVFVLIGLFAEMIAWVHRLLWSTWFLIC